MKFIKKYQHLIIACFLFLIISIVYLYKIIPSYNYDSDFGRDLNDILQITRGKMSLIGPKLSFGGIHAGPYYYYLFAPVLKIFSLKPESMIIFNALIFLIILAISFGIILKSNLKNKYSWLLGATWIFLSPFMIYSGRRPGNAFSYLALLFVLLIIFPWVLNKNKLFLGLIYGFFVGVVINFHLINLLIFTPLILITFVFYIFKKDWKKILLTFLMCLGILISFGPLLLFEARHNFVQFKNTFIDKSYIMFVDNKNLVDPLPTSSNRLLNFWLLQKHFTTWSQISFLVLFILTIVLLIIRWKKIDFPTKIYIFSSLFAFILLVLIAKSQVAIHYFFPFILAIQVSLIILISNLSPKISSKIFLLFLIISLIKFPKWFYSPVTRTIDNYRNFTNKLTSSDLFKNIDSQINVFCARETPVAILGWEYRYFMELNGYKVLAPTLFNQANQLLIIKEARNSDNIDSLKSWELDEFGPRVLNKTIEIDGRKIFLFDKKTSSTPKQQTR
ncbi:MAG TPA: hypothetical protein PK257_01305 [Candidatus Woesebacteria bacterium]|nr:hypothetical protein [Candidatus Woesebacteria bacterium]